LTRDLKTDLETVTVNLLTGYPQALVENGFEFSPRLVSHPVVGTLEPLGKRMPGKRQSLQTGNLFQFFQ
jgi:hypothetical protein